MSDLPGAWEESDLMWGKADTEDHYRRPEFIEDDDLSKLRVVRMSPAPCCDEDDL